MNIFSFGRCAATSLLVLTLAFPQSGICQGPMMPPIYVATFTRAEAGLGGAVQVHWGEMWAEGNLTSLPSETNLGHLDEKASGNNVFDTWARYRSSGRLAGPGFALSHLGGSGSWASRWSSVIPSNFNPGNAPLLYDDTGNTITLGDLNQPGWFPTKPKSDPPVAPIDPDAPYHQPAPDITDGRMTNAFFQNYPLPYQIDVLHRNRAALDYGWYHYFKTLLSQR